MLRKVCNMRGQRIYAMMVILFFAALSCEKEFHTLTSFSEERQVKPSEDKLHAIGIDQTDYDSLIIRNASDLILESKSIIRINLYKETDLDYTFIDSVYPDYLGSHGSYQPVFQFDIKVNKDDLFYKFKLAYLLYDSTTVEVDSFSTMCKYPYESAEVYLQYKDLPYPEEPEYKYTEDMDYYENKFYYRAPGSFGIYEIDEKNGDSRILIDGVSHNYMSVDSGFVFYTASPQRILKQAITSGDRSEVLRFNHTTFNDSAIMGMESENGVIYLIMELEQALIKIDYGGNFLESLPYPVRTHSLTKYENKLYSLKHLEYITVFNLANKTFEDVKPIPSQYTLAIKIADGYLYFTETEQAYIGRIPIEDVIAYGN